MKIINDNKLHGATYSATNESLNYPVSNLDHQFLAKRFQATDDNSVIDVTFTACTIDAIAHGLTNANSGTAALYTGTVGSYTLQETVTLDLTTDPCVSYPSIAIDNITRIVFTLSTTDDYLRLGGVAAGEAYDIEYPYSQIDRGYQDNSVWTQVPAGQSLSNYQRPLKSIPLTFDASSMTIANELIELYLDIGIGTPFFADFFQGYRDLMQPLYCCFSSPPSDTGSGRDRTITFNFQECK